MKHRVIFVVALAMILMVIWCVALAAEKTTNKNGAFVKVSYNCYDEAGNEHSPSISITDVEVNKTSANSAQVKIYYKTSCDQDFFGIFSSRFREQRLDPCADRRLAHLHLSHILLPEPESALRDRHAVRKPGFLKRPVLIDESEPHGFSHSVNNPGSA